MREEIVPPTPEWIERHKGHVEAVRDDKGNVTHARVKDRSVLAFLIERQVLEPFHEHYALVLQDMQRYFRRQVDYTGNHLYAHEFFSTSNSGILETLYLRVCRCLLGEPRKLIDFAIREQVNDLSWPLAWVERHAIREAFELLVQTIDEVRAEEREQADGQPGAGKRTPREGA